MTQQYLVGELSVILGEVQAAATSEACARRARDLRLEVESAPVTAANTTTADLWLGANWFAWAVLWAMFWALLTLELPIARITGWVAIIEGIGTSWALAIGLLEGKLFF